MLETAEEGVKRVLGWSNGSNRSKRGQAAQNGSKWIKVEYRVSIVSHFITCPQLGTFNSAHESTSNT